MLGHIQALPLRGPLREKAHGCKCGMWCKVVSGEGGGVGGEGTWWAFRAG